MKIDWQAIQRSREKKSSDEEELQKVEELKKAVTWSTENMDAEYGFRNDCKPLKYSGLTIKTMTS